MDNIIAFAHADSLSLLVSRAVLRDFRVANSLRDSTIPAITR